MKTIGQAAYEEWRREARFILHDDTDVSVWSDKTTYPSKGVRDKWERIAQAAVNQHLENTGGAE